MAKVGVLIDQQAAMNRWTKQENVIEGFVCEVLEHAGIRYELLSDAFTLASYHIVIVALEPDSDNETSFTHLWRYMSNGGIVIALTNMEPLLARMGYTISSTLHAGCARLPRQWGVAEALRFLEASICKPIHQHICQQDAANNKVRIHNYGEIRLIPDEQDAILGPVLQRMLIGSGSLHRWAVHLPATWLGLQQGTRPVIEDGFPAPDGTASINDHLLKADDSFELDWTWDRRITPAGSSFFPLPYADLWKEVFNLHLLAICQQCGLTLPFISYWPEGIEQVALISHDSDRNCDDSVHTTLAILREHEIQATWCLIEPGYSPEIYPLLLQDGHEMGLHYNAMEDQNGEWAEHEFNRQVQWFKDATQQDQIYSNKNHYTRFQGWGELFQWCEENGIVVDQTKGPSKRGNVGFLFGTCHPYYPIADWQECNRPYRVLELGFLTQDHLDHSLLEDQEVLHTFLHQVKRVHGVAHFTFHPVHIHNRPHVKQAFRKLLKTAQEYQFTFMTSKAIADWEHYRRSLTIEGFTSEGVAIVSQSSLIIDSPQQHAVVWIPVPEASQSSVELFFHHDDDDQVILPVHHIPKASVDSPHSEHVEYRYGVLCRKQVLSANPPSSSYPS
jgi:peptidoglycan/xylan/chitin deacetylase (PgdA/CDA1 family)